MIRVDLEGAVELAAHFEQVDGIYRDAVQQHKASLIAEDREVAVGIAIVQGDGALRQIQPLFVGGTLLRWVRGVLAALQALDRLLSQVGRRLRADARLGDDRASECQSDDEYQATQNRVPVHQLSPEDR